ncbi:MAG TPA: hypothetical protein VHZ73_11150 [Vicinamibacterales bacterium]|jgi:hypothetical protein|nr:hypothetical protein [Vicinamibacterales bacterium]
MNRRSRRTVWIAIVWLVLQLAAQTLPLAANSLVADADVCTCPGGTPGAPCPMHHHGHGLAGQPNAPAFRNACAQPDVTLLALAGGLGVLPQAVSVSSVQTPTSVSSIDSTTIRRAHVPDAPPPRA